jgi:hypothetical protein
MDDCIGCVQKDIGQCFPYAEHLTDGIRKILEERPCKSCVVKAMCVRACNSRIYPFTPLYKGVEDE